MSDDDMTDFQALITGFVVGALLKAPESGFNIYAETVVDQDGNYRPTILVSGLGTGEKIVITVDRA
jgi:hypothetical protein